MPEYFFNPLPNYLTQWILGGGEAPWVERINHKSLMGFYGRADLSDPGGREWEVMGQFLVDDIGFNLIAKREGPVNPNMMAWMLSGALKTPYGRFRATHAGAHMYTFQTSDNRRYSYTYYPEVAYPLGGEYRPIDYRDNYFGLYLGPNTAAFRLEWENEYGAFPANAALLPDSIAASASLAYTISGSKSPLNPWGDLATWSDHDTGGGRDHTRWLDEDVLEHGVELELKARLFRRVAAGHAVTLTIGGTAGVWFNAIALDAVERSPTDGFPAPNLVESYRPSDTTHRSAGVTLELRYAFAP